MKKIWSYLSDHESAGSGIAVISAIGMSLGIMLSMALV